MKQLIAALFISLLLPIQALATMNPAAFDWAPKVSLSVLQSIVRLESEHSICTGFVIDDEKDIILTANHCLSNDPLFADGEEVKVLLTSNELDLAVLHANTNKQSIKAGYAEEGEPVVSIGYGHGFPIAQVRNGYVMHEFFHIIAPDGRDYGDGYLILNYKLAGGMSGGPTVNSKGDVVGMNQLSSQVEEKSAARSSVVIVRFLTENRNKIWRSQ